MPTTDDILLRSVRRADLAALRAVAASALPHDDDAADLVDLLWDGSDGDEGLGVTAEAGGEVVGLALGSLSTLAAASAAPLVRGHVNLLAVAPEHRGRGHGRALLAALEQRLRDRGARRLVIRGSNPHYAWPGIDVRGTAAVCLAESSGYQRTAEAVNMLVDLERAPLDTEDDELRLAKLGLTIRRLIPEDLPRFGEWMRSWGGTWAAEAEAALDHTPVGCHIAVRGDGEDAEYLAFACHGVNRRAWFGPMGTAESLRGQGVGAVLLRRCLADQRAAGLRQAEIGWTGPIRFYARAVDAVLGRVFWLYQKEC